METEFTSLSDEQLACIGLVAMRWNQLENVYKYAIWGYAELSLEQGIAITTHMPMASCIESLLTYANEKFPDSELEKSLKILINRTHICKIKRDKIMHASWFHTSRSDTEPTEKLRINRQLHLGKQKFQKDPLHALAHEIKNITRELIALLQKNKLLPELEE